MAAATTKTWDSIFDRLLDDYREALAEKPRGAAPGHTGRRYFMA
jgi:hypothetical protein